MNCPLNSQWLTNSIVYKANTQSDKENEFHIDSTEKVLKNRFYNPKLSLINDKYKR